jgi:diguanylate cyclase (GGDEF)-like protein
MSEDNLTEKAVSTPATSAEPKIVAIDDEHLQRIRRLGKQLLGVANCLISFGMVGDKQTDNERAMTSIEAQFIDSIPLSNVQEFVEDAKQDRFLSNNKFVIGAPYIRFYASYPIRNKNKNNAVVGNLRLLDYAPRVLSEADKERLSDLAALVERELEFISMDAARQDLLKKNWSLRRESMIDATVGTWNRAAITRMLKQEIVQCRQEEKPLSILMTDLDAFKKISEAYGSNVGDALLVKTASRMRSCIRPHDSMGRYEEGKFLILLPGASHEMARLIAVRLQQAIKSNSEAVGDKRIDITISTGTVSTDQFSSADYEELIALACDTLLSAQKLGHNSIIQAAPRIK